MDAVLVLDSRPDSCADLCRNLFKAGFVVFAALSEEEALNILRAESPSVAVVELSAVQSPDLSILGRLKQVDPHLGIVVLASSESVRTAVKALRLGARDYIPGPVRDKELASAVIRAAEERGLRDEVKRLRTRLNRLLSFPNIVGTSPSFNEMLSQAKKASESSVTVLLLGETGTGKDLLAQAIHHNSPRCQAPFVTVDCTTIPETLFESELFGYERGAFTGADQRRLGKLELADGGTLFLDEVGTLPLNLQPKFLRVLESRSFTRLGGTATTHVDVRFLVATNADLKAEVEAKKFREDLYYRLNVFAIRIPPLKDRREDIKLLASHFVEKFAREHSRPGLIIDNDAMEELTAYHWPGNVRELKNAIQRAVVLSDENVTRDSISFLISDQKPSNGGSRSRFKEAIEEATKEAAVVQISKALQESGGNKTAAARLLGISIRNLYYLMRRYGI